MATAIDVLKSENSRLTDELSAQKEVEKRLIEDNQKLKELMEKMEESANREKEELEESIKNLKERVAKMLTIAKEKAIEASKEYNATVNRFMEKEKSLNERLFQRERD